MKPCKFRHNDESGKLSCEFGQSLRSCGLCTMRQLPAFNESRNPVPKESAVDLVQSVGVNPSGLAIAPSGGGCGCKKKAPVTS